MPHIPTQFMSTAPRADISTSKKPPVPYLGSGKGESNPVTRNSKVKAELVSRISPLKHEVDPVRIINMMSDTGGTSKRKYTTDAHTRRLVRDDNTSF